MTICANNYGLPDTFKEPEKKIKRRLILSVSSREKCGKTHFALTAPGPIAFFNWDTGTEGVVEKFLNAGKHIRVRDYSLPKRNLSQSDYEELYEGFESDFFAALGSEVRTIVIDTATELWELLRLSKLGRLANVKPHHYTECNTAYREMIREAFSRDKNLILLQKMKKEYVNDKFTGIYERAGFGDTGFLVQANITTWRRGKEFGLTVDDCRQNPNLTGEEFTGPMALFPFLASMIIEGSSPGEWE